MKVLSIAILILSFVAACLAQSNFVENKNLPATWSLRFVESIAREKMKA
jgi:hypothetical protein